MRWCAAVVTVGVLCAPVSQPGRAEDATDRPAGNNKTEASKGGSPAPARLTDERLLGAWQSDVERMIGEMREGEPLSKKKEAALRKLFGKMRITYSKDKVTTDLDGTTNSTRYEALGKDKVSVVIRIVGMEPGPFNLSQFDVIHFDGPNAYWLYTQIGGFKEYFKRVRDK